MTDGDALLAAIRAHPNEDVPRLAYAGWLDENGISPARARFIRLMIDPSARNRPYHYTERDARREGFIGLSIPEAREWGFWPWWGLWSTFKTRYRLTDRAFVLTAIHRVGPTYLPQSVTVRRGFVEGVRTDYAGWMVHGDALVSAHPITRVWIDCAVVSDFDPRTALHLAARHPGISFDLIL